MTDAPEARSETGGGLNTLIIGGIVLLIVLGLALIGVAVILALNAEVAAPGVEIVRDLMIIAMAFLMVIVGTAVVVLLIQIARLVNLLNNELQPLIEAASDTVNTVRGTASFLSKNLTEPVLAINSAVRGIKRAASDVDTIRQAAGIFATVVAGNYAAPTASEGGSDGTTKQEERAPVQEAPDAEQTEVKGDDQGRREADVASPEKGQSEKEEK